MYKFMMGFLLTLVCFISTAVAQEGHPLVGTWQGEWGSTTADSNFLTIIMYWDGKAITGLVNPGPDSTALQTVQLDSSSWTVTIETDLKDEASTAFHFKAKGILENIGSQTRSLHGEWQHESGKGNFTLTRQSGT